MFLSEL